MAESNDEKPKSDAVRNHSPLIPSPSHSGNSTRSSASLSPLGLPSPQVKDYAELCMNDENLPSKNISELWQRPLRLLDSNPQSKPSSDAESKDEDTPSRRNVFSRTKLVFDHLDPQTTFQSSRGKYRRSKSDPETSRSETPVSNPKRLKLFKEEETSPYEDLINSKPTTALKESNENTPTSSSSSLTPAVKKLFLKSQSDSILSNHCNTSIMTALEKMERDPTLIGDASTSYILPIKGDGKHRDLKEISGETLAMLLEAKEDCPNVSFRIIDCRYPYEFEGGHIRGAVNLYTGKQIKKELLEGKLALRRPSLIGLKDQKKNAREILIFHCEFSSQRGPNLCHYLRKIDRAANVSEYPFLYYPELYVLYGGYKEFYAKYPNLCVGDYVPMEHPEHGDSYRRYKSETKQNL